MNGRSLKSLIHFKIILDVIMTIAGFGLAYYIRFYTEILSAGNQVLSPTQTMIPLVIAIPLLLGFYNVFELYNPKRHFGTFDSLTRIVRSMTFTMLIILAVLFVFRLMDFSRWTLVLFYVFAIVLTTLGHMFINTLLERWVKAGRFLKSVLVLGNNEMTVRLIASLKENPTWGYQVVGILDNKTPVGSFTQGVVVIGKVKDLKAKLDELDIDIVMITFAGEDYEEIADVIDLCERAGVKSQIIPYYYKYIPAKPYMDHLDGLPVIDTRHVPLDNFLKSTGKRVFDIVFSIVAIVLTLPLMVFSYIMVKLTSPGPVIYRQERIGLDRKPFMMYKFRSMHVQVEEEEKTQWTTKDDPRKTRWGSFMRKTSIDELPQFFNVLLGNMSVVGPRPERPYFVDQFKETVPKYMIKHQVRPGITGWAQISGWRGDTSIEKRIEFDLYYIENWKFSLDMKIILLTVFKGFLNRNEC